MRSSRVQRHSPSRFPANSYPLHAGLARVEFHSREVSEGYGGGRAGIRTTQVDQNRRRMNSP